jgi:hypothetical protein
MILPKRTARFLSNLLIVLFGGMSFPSGAAAQAPANALRPATDRSPLPDLMMLHGRISIKTPGQPLHLGEENELALFLKGPPIVHLSVMQSAASADGVSPSIEGGDGEVTVQHHPDGSAYVSVVPQALGKIEFRLISFFSDGGMESDSATVPVIAVKPPRKLEVNAGVMFHSTITMDLSGRWRKENIWFTADYPGIKRPLAIPAKEAHFNVKTAKGETSIRFDPATGEIDALRLGPALIETTYRGLTVETCVLVTENSEFGAYRSNCDALKQGGKSRDEIVGAALAEDKSELPYVPMDGRRGRFVADERVDLKAPTQPLHLAQDNAIQITLRGPQVAWIECSPDGNFQCTAWKGEWSREGMVWTPHPDGTATIKVFPMVLGHETFTFFVVFADGGVAFKKISADVDLGTVKPRAISRWCGNPSPEAEMPVRLVAPKDGQEVFPGSETIVPTACYEGIRNLVALPANLVQYDVKTEGTEPVIQLDAATGKATALRPGQALVEQTFDGLTYSTCVVVEPPGNPYDRDVSNCRELRAKYSAQLPEASPPQKEPRIEGPGAAAVKQEMKQERAITQATLAPQGKDRFAADARLTIPMDGVSAALGEVSRLPVRVEGPAILQISIYQKRAWYRGALPPSTYEESTGEEEPDAGVLGTDAEGGSFVNILALEPDMAEFRVAVQFADGGMATRTVRVPVNLPENELPHLINALEDSPHTPAFPASTLHILLNSDKTRWMYPVVYFREDGPRVPLNPQQVTFSLEEGTARPVIQVDGKTGKITPLRLGHALVRTRYAGAEAETCVVVMADLVEGDKSNCEELQNRRPAVGPS